MMPIVLGIAVLGGVIAGRWSARLVPVGRSTVGTAVLVGGAGLAAYGGWRLWREF